MAIRVIKTLTPNKYLEISGDDEPFFLPAPKAITK